jgi:hypothetical protein
VPFLDSQHCLDEITENADVGGTCPIIGFPGGYKIPVFTAFRVAAKVIGDGVLAHPWPIGKPAVEFLQRGRCLTPLDGMMDAHHFFPGFTGFLTSFLGRGLADGLAFFVV